MREIRVLSPTAILGYGYPYSSFQNGINKRPDVIAVDAGSTDPGPYYLGSGKSFTTKAGVKRDLVPMLQAAEELGIPVIIGTAGGSGAKPHLDWTLNIIDEIFREEGFTLPTTVIPSEIGKEQIYQAMEDGKIKPCGPVSDLTTSAVTEASYVVAQMGVEPFVQALDQGAQLIVAGRAYDPAAFAALPIKLGFPAGLALHMGKILECAAIAATPGSGSDCMLGYLRDDCFVLEALNPKRKCTTTSVAAHTLYEKSDPYHLPGPGGTLDLSETSFTELDEGRVRVSGTRFVPTEQYYIKLEGARRVGHRTISIAGIRDPIMIAQLDDILAEVKNYVADSFSGDYYLHFHCYGKNGVMGELEPVIATAHEIGLVIDVVANSQEEADNICGFARSTLLHYGYPGRKSTAGNLAFPYSPSDFQGGEVYQFSIHHLLPIADPATFFPAFPWERGRNS